MAEIKYFRKGVNLKHQKQFIGFTLTKFNIKCIGGKDKHSYHYETCMYFDYKSDYHFNSMNVSDMNLLFINDFLIYANHSNIIFNRQGCSYKCRLSARSVLPYIEYIDNHHIKIICKGISERIYW